MNSTFFPTRRGLRVAIVGVGAIGAVFLVRGHDRVHVARSSFPPLSLSTAVPLRLADRLQALHARYDGLATESGVEAMRAAILTEVRAHRGDDGELEAIQYWISEVGWAECADICVDIAEVAGRDVRRSCAADLSALGSPLLSATLHGPRVVRLHENEDDPAAREYWQDLRTSLGV